MRNENQLDFAEEATGKPYVSRLYWKLLDYIVEYRQSNNKHNKIDNNKLFMCDKDYGREIKSYVITTLQWMPGVNINDLRHMYITEKLNKTMGMNGRLLISRLMAHSLEEQGHYNLPHKPSLDA